MCIRDSPYAPNRGRVITLNGQQNVANANKNFASHFLYFQKLKTILKNNNLLPSLPAKGITSYFHQNGRGSQGKETFNASENDMLSEITVEKAQKLLTEAILEFYLFLQLVKTYRDLNLTGFRKIAKKFDKTCETKECLKFMNYAKENYTIFSHIDPNIALMTDRMKKTSTYQPLVFEDITPENESDDPLLWWESKVRGWYIKDLTNSLTEMKRNNDKLRKFGIQYSLNERIIHRINISILQMTISGFFIGAAFSLIIYTLYLIFTSDDKAYIHRILFPLWGGWYMVLLISFLFIGNCFIWHRSGINYRFIMFGEIQARSGTQFFNNDFATTKISLKYYFISLFILACSILAIISFQLEKLTPLGFIFPGIVITLFLAPSWMIPFWDKLVETRKWLFCSGIRLIFSGFYPVEFGDFFLGDIVCSLTYSISDLAMFFCVYVRSDNATCSSSHLRSMGVLGCLPSFWRFMQCLRRFADSGDWFPHLLNAAKYTLGVAYNATLCVYRISPKSFHSRQIFIVFATLNATYTSIWDLVMDWSLLQPSQNNTFLRDDLYLAGKKNWKTGKYSNKRKSIYYFAMIWNVIVRFEWIVYAIAPQTIQQSADTSFILATAEVLRRFVWIIFRVENEHVANVNLFRVSGTAPLPYPINITSITPLGSSDSDEATNIIVLESNSGNDNLSVTNEPQQTSNRINRFDTVGAVPNVDITRETRIEEPMPAYHPPLERRTTTFGSISKSIPWAHTSDFQRPSIVATTLPGRDSDNESENESIASG